MNENTPFFIVGCPRSGTTLLSVLLDRHTRLCVPPETAFFDEIAPHLLHNNETLPEILRDWRRLGELNLDPEMILSRLSHRQSCGRVLEVILGLYAEAMGKVRCGEKTPQHLRHVPEILQEFPDAKVICMMRDGYEVALSLNSMPWWPPRNLADAANLWKNQLQLMETYIRRYPS